MKAVCTGLLWARCLRSHSKRWPLKLRPKSGARLHMNSSRLGKSNTWTSCAISPKRFARSRHPRTIGLQTGNRFQRRTIHVPELAVNQVYLPRKAHQAKVVAVMRMCIRHPPHQPRAVDQVAGKENIHRLAGATGHNTAEEQSNLLPKRCRDRTAPWLVSAVWPTGVVWIKIAPTGNTTAVRGI